MYMKNYKTVIIVYKLITQKSTQRSKTISTTKNIMQNYANICRNKSPFIRVKSKSKKIVKTIQNSQPPASKTQIST